MGKVILTVIVGLFILAIIGESSTPPENEREERSPAAQSSSSSEDEGSDTPAASEPAEPREPPSPWRVSRWTSDMDDSPAVALVSKSDELITGRFSGAGRAELLLRCLENTTNLYVKMNGHFLADIQGYGNVRYRIDDRQPATLRMKESTDNEALGLWSGGQSIPVIRRMFGHDKVTMQVTPFNQSPVTVSFPITGLEETIAPLRQACHW